MANEILLVNPRRRRKSSRKRRRNPGRRRAPVSRRKTSRRRRRRNPIPGTTRKRLRRRRRNPTFSRRDVTAYAQGAAKGAAGAIALDVALAYIPLPANFKAGWPGRLVKAAGAIALGVVARRSGMVTSATARDMTVGALTVQFAGIGRELLGQFAPGIALSAYLDAGADQLGYAGSGWDPTAALQWGAGMGAYNVGEGFDVAAPGYGQPGLDAYDSGYGGY